MFYLYLTFWLFFGIDQTLPENEPSGETVRPPRIRMELPTPPDTRHIDCCGPLPPPPIKG